MGEKPSLATGEGAESSLIVGCSGQAQPWHRPGWGRRYLLPGLVFPNGIQTVKSTVGLLVHGGRRGLTVNRCAEYLAFLDIQAVSFMLKLRGLEL